MVAKTVLYPFTDSPPMNIGDQAIMNPCHVQRIYILHYLDKRLLLKLDFLKIQIIFHNSLETFVRL